MTNKTSPSEIPSGVGRQDAEPKTPNGGLNQEVGELEPEAPETDEELPGKAGGGLAGG